MIFSRFHVATLLALCSLSGAAALASDIEAPLLTCRGVVGLIDPDPREGLLEIKLSAEGEAISVPVFFLDGDVFGPDVTVTAERKQTTRKLRRRSSHTDFHINSKKLHREMILRMSTLGKESNSSQPLRFRNIELTKIETISAKDTASNKDLSFSLSGKLFCGTGENGI